MFFEEGGVATRYCAPSLTGAGAFILILISFKQFTQVKKTRNTVFLDKKFMFFQLYACFFLGSASIYGLCGAWNATWGPINCILVFINVCLFAANYYTLQVKLSNTVAAKKANMSESEYYNQVIAPSLALQTN